jgi:signal transduction histidine kinase
VILANVEYALTRPGIVPEAWDALHDVVGSVQNMLGMILNLLDVSRSRDGKLVPSIGTVDVRALSEEVSGTWRRRAESDGRTVQVEGTLDPAVVYADVDLLRRVLENLLDNALRHTPKGTRVTLVLSPGTDLVRIAVKDEGGGIPADARARIFEKYGRLGGPDSQGRSGRGLGLVFCRLAVEAHRGRIWVEDNVPKGSAFVFEIPVGTPPPID